MEATDTVKRIYVYPNNTDDPVPPPGFVLDPTVPAGPVPPPDTAPPPVDAPWQDVPPPPAGFTLDSLISNIGSAGIPPGAHKDALNAGRDAIPGGVVNIAKSIATLPQRAIEASQADVANQYSGDRSDSDPERTANTVAPALDTALMTMGTGAAFGAPAKAGEAVLGAGPVRRTPAAVSPPPPAGYVLDGTVQSLANDLQTLRQSAVADKAEVGNAIRALPEETKTPAIGEKLYHAAEDPALLNQLSPEERALFDQHLEPLRQEQFDLALEAKKLGRDDLNDDPNFMHRIAKGHAPQYDDMAGGNAYDPVTGTKGLPRTTSALQSRTFYAIENPAGVRKVISTNDNGITVWNNRTGTSVPTSAEIKPGEVVDINGTNWTVKPARTKEIEQHGQFQGNKPAEYHKNAFVNTADAIVHLREVVRNLKFLQDVKKSQWWLNHAQLAGGNRMAPKGWVRPKMPQLHDWYVDPKIAAVLDDFYKPGLFGDIPAAQGLREINQFATSSMFWNPIPHMQNVGVHWAVGRGWDWIRPGPLRHFATDMTRAIKATVTQNHDYQRFLRQGGGLVSGGVRNADFYGDLGRHMGMQIEKNWSQYQPLFKKLGITKPAQAVAWWYDKMRNVLWQSSDMFMMHRYLELERKGMSSERAMREAEKHIPNYRIPSEIMGSRFLSQVLQEPALTNFARYHYGMWKSFMEMATDLAKGTPAEKKEALGNVAALAFMGYVIYPTLDALYQKATGDPNAKFLRRGAMSVPHGLAEVSRDRQSFSQFLGSNITMSPGFKELLQQFIGKDFFTGQDLGGMVPRTEHAAGTMVSPYNTAQQVFKSAGDENARGPGRQAVDTIVGGENTSEKTEKGKQYGAVLRQRAAKKHAEKPSGPIEGAYYGAKRAVGLEEPVKEPKAKKPKGEKKSHHNKEKGY